MARSKQLTLKSPNMMNLATLLIVLLCILSPGFRYNIGGAFIWVGNTLQGEIK
jgi:hypothetical protein